MAQPLAPSDCFLKGLLGLHLSGSGKNLLSLWHFSWFWQPLLGWVSRPRGWLILLVVEDLALTTTLGPDQIQEVVKVTETFQVTLYLPFASRTRQPRRLTVFCREVSEPPPRGLWQSQSRTGATWCSLGAAQGWNDFLYSIFICFMCIGVLPAVCLCTVCVQYPWRPERVWDPLEL